MATYKNETLKKYTNNMTERIYEYLNMSDADFAGVHTCISRGDRKIGATRNVSQAPVISCGNCAACMHHCYDIKACLRMPAVSDARARNTALAHRDRDRYFAEINTAIAGDDAFRWHQGGDMTDADYLDHMAASAELNAGQRQWGYTHRRDIVNAYIDERGPLPENLSIMYSYEGTEPAADNPHGMPEFRCIKRGDTPPAGFMQCPGNCRQCLDNHTGCPYGMSSWCYEH